MTVLKYFSTSSTRINISYAHPDPIVFKYRTLMLWRTTLESLKTPLLLQEHEVSRATDAMSAESLSRFTRRASAGSSSQEPLITSFSHCCWQFSTSMLWEPPLHSIVFSLTALCPHQWPVHTYASRKLSLTGLCIPVRDVLMIIPGTLSLGRKRLRTVASCDSSEMKTNWLPGFGNIH